MSWTKRQFITQAFEEIGLAAYVFDLTPEQLDSACRRMDAMVAGWNANGVRIAYPLATSPGSTNLDDDTNVPDFANEAIYLNLACRIGPSFGKIVSPETKLFASVAYSNVVGQTAEPTPERQMPQEMPRGQGAKPWRDTNNPYLNAPQEQVNAGSDGAIEFE